jgi:hypothetical protein
MNTLSIIEPEFVEVKMRTNGWSGKPICLETISMLPYSNTHWKYAVEKFGIRIPSVLTTLADGKTTCTMCNSVYSGCQFVCDNDVDWYEYKTDYHTITERGYFQVGDVHRTSYSSYRVVKSYRAPCLNTSLEWTNRQEFGFQQDFFNLLSLLSGVSNKDTSVLARFSEFIPHAKYDLIESNLMRGRLDQLEMRQEAIVNAVRQIAERMTQAGNCLNVGNL